MGCQAVQRLTLGHFEPLAAAGFFQHKTGPVDAQHPALGQPAAGLDGFHPTTRQADHGLQVILCAKQTQKVEPPRGQDIGLRGVLGYADGGFGCCFGHFQLFSGHRPAWAGEGSESDV